MTMNSSTGPDVTCPFSEITTNCATVDLPINAGLLQSNFAPSASEAQHILKAIAHGDFHLLLLEGQIQNLRKALTELEGRQAAVKNYVTCQRSLLSPIRRIPPETLGQIFLELQNISETTCFGDDALENIELWTLLRVCRFWRDVASSLSELWSTFSIIRQPFSNRPTGKDMDLMLQQSLHLTQNCISYSHSRPLHFVFHANEEFIDAAKMLAAESSRWMSVAFNNLPILQALEPDVFGQVPLLRSLEIDGLGKEWEAQAEPLQAFQQAPSLTRLSLYELDRPHTRFILPWRQITHLTSFELRNFLPILHLMPFLVELKSIEDVCQIGEIQERILLPNLERLEVTSNSPTTSQIFDALLTPKLNTLRLFSKRGFSRIYAAAVVQMVQSSECRLRVLAVSDYAVDSTVRILSALQDLEELSVTNLMYPSELLSMMNTHRMLPKLCNLTLRKCAPERNLWASLVRLLRNRPLIDGQLVYNGLNPIETVSVGLSVIPDNRFLRDYRDTVWQLAEIDVNARLELIGLFDFVYPATLSSS